MSIEEIINSLNAHATLLDSVQEPYLGYVHRSRTADVIREAIALLRTHPDAQPNDPLTLEALRGMHGKPGWLDCKYEKGWGIIGVYEFDRMVSINTLNDTYFIYTNGEYNDLLGAKLYRRPPKEETV